MKKKKLAKIFGNEMLIGMDKREHFNKMTRQTLHGTLYHFILFVIKSKNKAFNEEQEVRLATYWNNSLKKIDLMQFDNGHYIYNCRDGLNVYSNLELKFRTKPNLLIPYIEFRFPKEAIKEIIIGPTQDVELVMNSLGFFLRTLNIKINIKQTNIPYRVL